MVNTTCMYTQTCMKLTLQYYPEKNKPWKAYIIKSKDEDKIGKKPKPRKIVNPQKNVRSGAQRVSISQK